LSFPAILFNTAPGRKFSLSRANPARRVIFLPAANSSRGPQFPWVRIFLKTFFLRHATLARRDTFLQAAVNFLRDLQYPRVSSFGSPRRPAACFQPLPGNALTCHIIFKSNHALEESNFKDINKKTELS
jgi:hypothetical protein